MATATAAKSPVDAVSYARRMRGGAQSHLLRCSDGEFYVVKFQNNPQHIRVLANELFASQLAHAVGLPAAAVAIVYVSSSLIEDSPELIIQVSGRRDRCRPGLQFGSRLVLRPFEGQIFDWLSQSAIVAVRNVGVFAGMLAFDKWTCNADGRQAVFYRHARQRKYSAAFIDHGYCFNGGDWTFPDSPLRGTYPWNEVYASVNGWNSFEPWLSQLEDLRIETISKAAAIIPPEWYGDRAELDRLVERLIWRRKRVRELILEFRRSTRNPFPNWTG